MGRSVALGAMVALLASLTATPTLAASPSPTASDADGLTLVAVGDSIPFNTSDEGFVARYGDALGAATGATVTVNNLSEGNAQVVAGLLTHVKDDREWIDALSAADAIVVGIAHNDIPWDRLASTACDGEEEGGMDWSVFTDECLAAEVERFTPEYEDLFATMAALRAGQPTILRAINRYNDWPAFQLGAEGLDVSARIIAAWNEMICGAAEANGFLCADISTRFNGPDGKQESGDLLADDYTHPSDKGNEAIAQVLVDLGFAPFAD